MEQDFSAATLATSVEEEEDGFIEDNDDLLRASSQDLALQPPPLQAITRRQQELGGGPVAAFIRCPDRGCSACQDPDCGNRQAAAGLQRLCLACHNGNPTLCLIRNPCLSWPFEKLNQFREAQQAYAIVAGDAMLTSPGPTTRLGDEQDGGEDEEEAEVPQEEGAVGWTREGRLAHERQQEQEHRAEVQYQQQLDDQLEVERQQEQDHLEKVQYQQQLDDQLEVERQRADLERGGQMEDILHQEDENLSGITPKMDESLSKMYHVSPRAQVELRRTENKEDLSQLYGGQRLGRGDEHQVHPVPAPPGLGGRRERLVFGPRMTSTPGPRMTSPPDRSVKNKLNGSQAGLKPPIVGWLGPRVQNLLPHQFHRQEPPRVLGGQANQNLNQNAPSYLAVPQPPAWWRQRPHPNAQTAHGGHGQFQQEEQKPPQSQQDQFQPPQQPPQRQQGQFQPLQQQPQRNHGQFQHQQQRHSHWQQTNDTNIAQNQEKIVDFLQLMTDKLMAGPLGGEKPTSHQLRLPNLSLPLPRKTTAGRIETKEYHLWRISLEKTISNNHLSEDAVLSLLANNVKLTSDEWLATFQSSSNLQDALGRLDQMHAPIQHLYGQLIRQITEAPPLHGVNPRERIYQLNELIQYTEEFITFFGQSTDLNRENILICLAKIADSKEGRDMSLRNIYVFDEAFRGGRPYCQSLKDHLIEARLLAVDLESALESISDAEGKKSTAIRTAAVSVEQPQPRRGRKEDADGRGRAPGRARGARSSLPCPQCDQPGHPSFYCPDLKKIKKGESKLKATLCKQCLSKVEAGKPHLHNCATKRLFVDNAFVLLKFTCDHGVHTRICPHPKCVDAKTKRVLDPDQNPAPTAAKSFASRVVSLASSSQAPPETRQVAFLKELTALRGKDGQILQCLVLFDSMGSKSFIRYKEGTLPSNFDWGPRNQQQTYAITTITGEHVLQKNVYEVRLVSVRGLEKVTVVEGGLPGELYGSILQPELATVYGIDSPTREQLNEPQVVLILGSDMSHLMPRVRVPPRPLRRQQPGMMLAESVVSNRTLYFGPVQTSLNPPRMAQA